MRIKRHAGTLCALLATCGVAALFFGGTAKEKGETLDFFPVADVKAGMKGYGLTVFSGHDPEKFDVEVISVIKNFLPKQDVILARCIHPVLEHTGVIAGMSGSPVYLDGKLAGAVAYAWHFGKDPIAGITPAESMIPYFDVPSIPVGSGGGGAAAAKASSKLLSPLKGLKGAAAPLKVSAAAASPGADYWKLFKAAAVNDLVPLVTPLSGSLLSSGAGMAILQKELGPFFMTPVASSFATASFPMKAGGAGGAKGKGKDGGAAKAAGQGRVLRPGDAVSVQIVRGDLSLDGTGTVTAARGKKFVAFGHPMFNFGQVDVPAAAAFIHHTMASLFVSFKVSDPLDQVGTLSLDKQAGILIDTEKQPRVIPMTVRMKDLTRGAEETWHMEIAHNRLITPGIVRGALTAAVDNFALDIEEAVVTADYEIGVAGHKPVVLHDKVYQPMGTLGLQYSDKLGGVIMGLMLSDFEQVVIDRVDASVEISFDPSTGVIIGGYLSGEEAEEGDRVDVFVIVRNPKGGEKIFSVPFTVPGGFAGKQLSFRVEPGRAAAPDTVTPYCLDDVIENLSKGFPPDALVVTVQLPAQGVSVNGKLIKDLPQSALDTLKPQVATFGEQSEAVVDRLFIYPGMIVEGDLELRMSVKGKGAK